MDERSVRRGEAFAPPLSAAHWPAESYHREELPERVLLFGTGMLLRALVASAVDAANAAGAFGGRIVAIQSTPLGQARALNQQDGLFTLLERGLVRSVPVERARIIGSIARGLLADAEWEAVRSLAARPELGVIVSNVTEAGFRLGPNDHEPRATGTAPHSFPARLTDLLYTRYVRLPEGPRLLVIPTELVDDNGPRLADMVRVIAARLPSGKEFLRWLERHVRFASSLVDRITTAPTPALREKLVSELGYRDELLTLTEPHALWAIEAQPDELRRSFAVAGAPGVVIAPDIGFHRERKLRLLNGAHSALAPLALLAGVATVREATRHPALAPLLRQILFEEIVPATGLPVGEAEAFARSVLDRFGNPWLEHEWRVIVTNQTAKLRLRLVPTLLRFVLQRNCAPGGLAHAWAGYLRYSRSVGRSSAAEGIGSWRGASYPIVDVELPAISRHWRAVDPNPKPDEVPVEILETLAARALSDTALWGANLAELPGFLAAVTHSLRVLERGGTTALLTA